MRPLCSSFALIALITAAAASAAVSDYIRFDQPAPDSRTFVTATIVPRLSCAPKPPTVAISGSQIAINVEYFGGVCIATYVPTPVTAKIGVLPAGAYDVVLTGAANSTEHATLVVRGVDPHLVVPNGGPATGGSRVLVTTHLGTLLDFASISVSLGGVVITDAQIRSDGGVSFIAPAHAPGDVDFTETFTPREKDAQPVTFTTRAAYRYYDPAATPDPFVFERILFPIAYEGAGAFASTWSTDSSVGVFAFPWVPPGFAVFWKAPCASCSAIVDAWDRNASIQLDKNTTAAGTLLYAVRGTADGLVVSSHIRDLSRQAQSAGVDIPVVRESDFRSTVILQNIPTDNRFRAMLRVWSLADVTAVSVGAQAGGKGVASFKVPMFKGSTEALPFGSFDITPILAAAGADKVTLTMYAYDLFGMNRVWAMVSITNNETQEVTIVAPH